jgi:glycosyltransferase involved in cell wall biosynthesis
MLESSKPKIFRWHIPFIVEELPEYWHDALLRYFSSYDAVLVSCRRYLQGLRQLGYKGPAHHLFPYIDPKNYPSPSALEVSALRDRLGIKEDERVILNVARLDPMKAQDVVIHALKRVVRSVPEAKLVLVGNGSFSASKGGIGLNKAELWLQYLQKVANELGLLDRVVFAGYLNERELAAAYAMGEVFVLPSIREGFGLVVVEAWLYKKPVVVSSYAGVSDLISEGRNGLTFDPIDKEILAKKIISVLKNEDFAKCLGSSGFRSSRQCHLEAGVDREVEILNRYIGGESNGLD